MYLTPQASNKNTQTSARWFHSGVKHFQQFPDLLDSIITLLSHTHNLLPSCMQMFWHYFQFIANFFSLACSTELITLIFTVTQEILSKRLRPHFFLLLPRLPRPFDKHRLGNLGSNKETQPQLHALPMLTLLHTLIFRNC